MKEIIFLRHGDTDATENHYFAGWSDLPLTKKGEKRIKAAKEILKNYEYLEIWSSPLIRTRQTAQIVVNSNYSIQYTEDIKERSFGEWEGKNWELLEQEFPNQIKKWKESPLEFTPPLGESFADVLLRVKRFWQTLQDKNNGNYLVVTHAGVIRCLLVLLTGMTFENSFHLLLNPGVIIKVRDDSGFFQVTGIINHEDL
ncbi:MAG TPA: histidine phosphatase family protein [Atribacter sp.]|jgi:alpha-ribazole phosphatase|uniref:phosphoglycerate mutase (2,3-diphosphoglycerate-dependent) n=1 Tax=Candidatus Atribacter allofermentans TaxID=1852833 RepID=A0A1V5T2L8_9BACT|nr:histidine phosphatase family protein [Atribacter sp.]MDD3713417.1 histidine phosphatase family protein [Atribacterota bacterium]OQA61017.1 MAG: putative phosphoserine phosphatase 2 [Candidatus Atribacteria bacterium ADurb.Bin276]HHT09950.1 histidine phosphatase family protein [Candidatus Atribacteria bacterium]MDI9595912.1 histidine phosphatase family protein [Atribacterota bacterium]HOT05920.1 histidine phosphatase family protein [Atribacter sp.]